MRQNTATPNFRKAGRNSEIRKEIMQRLWKGEILDKTQVGIEFYSTKDDPMRAAQNLLTGLRKKVEKFTGKILICREGKYRLIFDTDPGEAIHEMGRRRKRVVHAIDSFGRPAEYLLTQDTKGEMAQIVNGAIGTIGRSINRYSFDKLAERATAKTLPEASATPKEKK